MKRWIALLRGINISGKNKIPMSDLKAGFEELGFKKVVTYLNSGNVMFDSDIDDNDVLSNHIQFMISERFELDIPVLIVCREELEEMCIRDRPGPAEKDDVLLLYQ